MLPTIIPQFAPVTFSYPKQTPANPFSQWVIKWTSSYLIINPRETYVVQCNSNNQPIFFDLKPSEGRPPWFLTTLKVLSYCTIILPILALAFNLFFSSQLNLRALPLKSSLFNQTESPLCQLPDEILCIILKNADMASRSAFALTCRKGKKLVEGICIRQVPLDLRKTADPFLTVRHLLGIPEIDRLEETYSWMRKKTETLRGQPHMLIPQKEGQALSEEQLFLLREAALHLLKPVKQELRRKTEGEGLIDRSFDYLQIDIDPRSWFGYGDLTVLRREVSTVILERIKQISSEHPLLPVQVTSESRAERELPPDFTLPLVTQLAENNFFVSTNGTVNPENVPQRLRDYLRYVHVWQISPGVANIPAFQYLNEILRQQLQIEAQ